MSAVFKDVPEDKILRFLAENPLAWIIPVARPENAVLMPVLLDDGGAAPDPSFLGHLPKRAPVTQTLAEDGRAVLLFLGPHSYVPPGWISKPGWVPTWNFVSLKASGSVNLDASLTEEAVRRLVDHMERPSGSGWKLDEIGPRREALLAGIIGFRCSIDTLSPRFKTGQDETEQSRAEIRAGLAGHPLRSWMGE